MTDAAAVIATGEGGATDGPIYVDKKMDALRSRASWQARECTQSYKRWLFFIQRVKKETGSVS